MAGGPIAPISAIPATSGRVFPHVQVASSVNIEGLGVEASVGADATWNLVFQMPPTLPTGTAKLLLQAIANATSGVAKPNPKWVSVAAEENPFTASRNAEGVGTITWAAGDANVFKELKIDLDADTIVAGEHVVLDLVMETASWTLAVVSLWPSTNQVDISTVITTFVVGEFSSIIRGGLNSRSCSASKLLVKINDSAESPFKNPFTKILKF